MIFIVKPIAHRKQKRFDAATERNMQT